MANFYASLRRQRKEAFFVLQKNAGQRAYRGRRGGAGADTEAAACPVSDVQRCVCHLDISG